MSFTNIQFGCSPCQPANSAFRAACTDPGTVVLGTYLGVYDNQFCPRRLAAASGFVVISQTGSGQQVAATNAPTVPLGTFQGAVGSEFGNLVIIGADGVWRQLLGPVVANQVLLTNALGNFYFGPIPAATVPDPLTITTLNATTVNTTALNVTGLPTFAGLGTGTITQNIGLNAANQLIIGSAATTGVHVAMFFEAPTSPSATTPNANTAAGALITIGNLIFDSVLPVVAGGALWTATNSQTLTCVTPGTYIVNFEGQVTYDSGSSGNPAILLLVNGLTVSNGNSRPSGVTTTLRAANLCGTYSRRFVAGDTLQLQLGAGAGSNTNVYEARVNLSRTGE